MNTNEQMIREQAYELWDHAGRPDGRSDEFWFAAKVEFEREEKTGEGNLGRMFPRMLIRLVMNIKAKRGLTQLGGPRNSPPLLRRLSAFGLALLAATRNGGRPRTRG